MRPTAALPFAFALCASLVGTARAEAPEGVPATDPEPWEDAWTALVDGPPGCWEVVGKATWNWSAGRFGGIEGDAVFVGRLVDGEWQDFVTRSLGETARNRRQDEVRRYPHDETRFVPMLGRRKPKVLGDRDTGMQVFDAMLDALGTQTVTLWSEWSDAENAVILHRAIPIGGAGEEAVMKVRFPEGRPVPAGLTVAFPESFAMPGRRIVRVRDIDVGLRAREVGGRVFAEAEAFSFKASVLGFQGSGAQTITYRSFRPCGAATEATPQAIVE